MTETLKQAIRDAGSIRAVSIATGVSRQSMMYFLRGDRSLRLDIADKLAAFFGLELTIAKPAKPLAKKAR